MLYLNISELATFFLSMVSQKTEVITLEHGFLTIAKSDFKQGEVVVVVNGQEVGVRDRYTIQIKSNLHN